MKRLLGLACLCLPAAACDGHVLSDTSSGGGASVGASIGTVTFQLTGKTGYACEGDGVDWLHIARADGTSHVPLQIETPELSIDCSTCKYLGGAIGGGCFDVASGGGSSWDGMFWQPGTCDGGSACFSLVYAPAGSYAATMCSSPDPDMPATMSECVTVPFMYPTTSPVAGTLM